MIDNIKTFDHALTEEEFKEMWEEEKGRVFREARSEEEKRTFLHWDEVDI